MSFLFTIVGPTAIGKSDLAMDMAQHFQGEIVSGDSCQVYRYMDIGTAKPTPEERSLVNHHLIDIIYPDEPFSLALYQERAYHAVNDILSRGKLPFLVGGSGLYIKAVIGGYRIPQVPPDFKLRVQLEENARSNGSAILVEQLQRIDPVAAQRIDPRNIRRLIRAIEVYHVTGKPFSELTQTTPPPFKVFNIGLTTERQELYKRIDLRVDGMIKKGLIEEVKSLVERGYSYSLPSMQCLGYKQIGAYLREEVTLDEAINQIKIKTRNFARRQYSWYKLEDSVKWFDINDSFKEPIESIIKEYIHV